MLRDYVPLKSSLLQPRRGFSEPTQSLPPRVALEDSALIVMTDFKHVSAVVIRPDDTVDEANKRMIQRGVRLLLVIDANRKVAGIITATDILGEKPLQVITERGGRHGDVLVGDIMTPQPALEVLAMADVRNAKVGHIVATLKQSGRQHATVVDIDDRGQQTVRGLFSATQIARQLGISIQTSEIAQTFSQIEALLAH